MKERVVANTIAEFFKLLLFESSGFLCSSSFRLSFEHGPSKELDCSLYTIWLFFKFILLYIYIYTYRFIIGQRLWFGFLKYS